MVTIHRASGLKVVIFLDDHEPAHVHVFWDGHAKINLVGDDGFPRLIWAEDMRRSDIRKAMNIVADHRIEFLARWNEIHG